MSLYCAGAHHGEDLLVHAVRQDVQGAAHPAPPPQDPQLRVSGAVRGLQESLQDKVAGQRRSTHFKNATETPKDEGRR